MSNETSSEKIVCVCTTDAAAEADGCLSLCRGRDGAARVILIGLIVHVPLVGGLAARFEAVVSSAALPSVYVSPV